MIFVDVLDFFSKPIRKLMTEREYEKIKMWIEECEEILVKTFMEIFDEIRTHIREKIK